MVTSRSMQPTQMREPASIVEIDEGGGEGEGDGGADGSVKMRDMVVLSSVLLIDFVFLLVGESRGNEKVEEQKLQ